MYRAKSKIYWTIADENDLIDYLKESKEAGEMFEEELRRAARGEVFISKFSPYTGKYSACSHIGERCAAHAAHHPNEFCAWEGVSIKKIDI